MTPEKNDLLQHISGHGPVYVFIAATDHDTWLLGDSENGKVSEWMPDYFMEWTPNGT